MIDIADRARGRWFEVLPLLGIDREYLRRTPGPCPICGGRDRFRWLDDIGFGNYACRQCGPGDGFILLRKKYGWSADEARSNVDDLVGSEPVWSERHAIAYRLRDYSNRMGRVVLSIRVEDHKRGFFVTPVDWHEKWGR